MIWLANLPNTKAYKRKGSDVRKGEPDISGCTFGMRFEIECKVPGEEPTKLQRQRLKEWAKAGAITGVSHSLDETKGIILPHLPSGFTNSCGVGRGP